MTKKERKYDLTGAMISFETGELSDEDILELFSRLIKNGMAYSLQGSYGRAATALINNGYISKDGNILKHISV